MTPDNLLKVRTLLHLGTKKNCPVCKMVQNGLDQKPISQIREFRFWLRNREVFWVRASALAYEDGQQIPWDIEFPRIEIQTEYPIEFYRNCIAFVESAVNKIRSGLTENEAGQSS